MNSIPSEVTMCLSEFKNTLAQEYGDKIDKIIVFGSYARGDYDSESDIDVAVIFNDADDDFIRGTRKYTSRITTDFALKYNKLLSPIKFDKALFEQRALYVPFYMNIQKEGIEI